MSVGLLIHLLLIVANAAATPSPRGEADTPEALAAVVVREFASGSATSFSAVYPFVEGRRLVEDAIERGARRHAGVARVVRRNEARAVLLLSGYTTLGNSGAETLVSRSFSDFYEAKPNEQGWAITSRLSLDEANRIEGHDLWVEILPGEALRVVDTMAVVVATEHGFAARLNHQARIESLTVDGNPTPYVFEGGLLWVDAPPSGRASISLRYRVPVPRDPSSWVGYFLPESGLARDQFLWHPVLNYLTPADRSAISVAVRIDSTYHVDTSVPQTERLVGDQRVVLGRSTSPVSGVSLLYDRRWSPYTADVGAVRLDVFADDAFQPDRDALTASLRRAVDVLTSRFGPPFDAHLSVVQRRDAPSSGWHFRTNHSIVAGRAGGPLSDPGPFPRAYLGHELAHGWTQPAGSGAMFLVEGWATFAESLLLADEYDESVRRRFWEAQRNRYEIGGFEGLVSIVEDEDNGGVAYSKGAWILEMLRERVGDVAFDEGVQDYRSIPVGRRSGWTEFADAMSLASGTDVLAWLRRWLLETTIPDVDAHIEDRGVVLVQGGPTFDLSVPIDLYTEQGVVRRVVHVFESHTLVPTEGLGPVVSVVVDPEHRTLMKRHHGEVVRFALDEPAAASVTVGGDFTGAEIRAESVDGVWTAEVPLTEGVYRWHWVVDGTRRPGGDDLVVRPVREVGPESYPRAGGG